MDEVENPELPAAGEASPTIRPVEAVDVEDSGEAGDAGEADKPGIDTVEAEGILDPEPPAKVSSPEQIRIEPPPRPPLQREDSVPPPQQPPPAPPEPSEFPQEPPDSLTLADLKRIRSTFPNAQAQQKQQLLDFGQVYDFEYQDAQSLPVEIEEWFSYSDAEQMRLRQCKITFHEDWHVSEEGRADWVDAGEDARRAYVTAKLDALADSTKQENKTNILMVLTYLALGVWEETAGRSEATESSSPDSCRSASPPNAYDSSCLQIHWIVAMVDTLHAGGGLPIIYDTLQKIADRDFSAASSTPDMSSRHESQAKRPEESTEMWCCLTLMYLFIEVGRVTGDEGGRDLRKDIAALEPKLLTYFTQVVAMLRWEESLPIPLVKMMLLSWKTILVTIGGIKDVENVKASLREDKDEVDPRGQPIITASPLDYHLFRQEISSKYPAYQPPPPLFPLEPENNSILPPLKHRSPSYASTTDTPFTGGAPSVATGSIMHQPVHIATPAPSPPPSPGGPGKAGKKQNYQTNQMFPFLYPPLDPSSNDLGGKGSTELQDLLVGRKWEGCDIPASIMEAAELFAKRMRATRAMKQLWEVRVEFMKAERGWKNGEGVREEGSNGDAMAEGLKKSLDVLRELRELGIDGLDGLEDFEEELDDGDVAADYEMVDPPAPEETAEQGKPLPRTDEQRRLDAVDEFYRESLQHLQSVVIVLLKAVLENLTDLVTKGNGQNGLQAGIQFNDAANGINGSAKPMNENGTSAGGVNAEGTADEIDKLRSQEIGAKALSAILLLLLKWFKASHILQYEYLTQLLVDSNYVPLILKLWQTQEIGRACHYKLEREEANFFYFCQDNSRRGRPSPRTKPGAKEEREQDEQSEDEALPPPIKLKRDSPEPTSNPLSPTDSPPDFTHPPEVDELGYPQTPLPPTPITTYSYRNIFTSINYLRILQKITRRKTHRALLLINYKSSNHLKKSLRVPVHLLRYYTLKLFKSQVPFCGRKWRQGNMKIITAVWLSVPAQLRDDWLSGGGGGMGGACVGDVDGTVDDALPLEQSLRALTHWWNLRHFPQGMGVERGMGEAERGFFERELERMEVGVGMGREGDVMVEEEGEEGQQQWSGPIEGY